MAIDYDKVLREGVGKLLRGEKPDVPPGPPRARDHDAELKSWVQDQLHEKYDYRLAADLRAADAAAQQQAARQPADAGEEALADMLAGLSATEREAWDLLTPEIQTAALRADQAALETWGAVERSITRGVPLAEVEYDDDAADDEEEGG